MKKILFILLFPVFCFSQTSPDIYGTLKNIVEQSRTLTINGSAQDLSANRTWSVGTLTGGDTLSLSNRLNQKLNSADTLSLSNRLGLKLTNPNGTTLQYIRGDGSLATFPTSNSSFTNGAGYLIASDTSSISSRLNAKFTLPSLTNGSILFSNGSTISQDNAAFFWDDTNNKLGIGLTPQSTWGYLQILTGGSGTTQYANITLADNITNNTSKGGMIAGAPYTLSNKAYTGFGTFTTPTEKGVYLGGGGWTMPDANSIYFYTAPSFVETNNTGVLRMRISPAGLIQIAGTTSSFGAIKTKTAGLIIRLADDSGNANLEVKDSVYAASWNGNSDTPTKNAVYDKVESIAPIAGSFSGVGTATTTFTVTIGTTMANTTYKVNATPTDLLAAAAFYISSKSTTTFDVTYLTGLTGTVSFDWSVFP